MTLDEKSLLETPENEIIDLDVLVVGAGLFGSIIGRALENIGRTVSYIDAGFKKAGSRPAGCLMRPSWLSSMGSNAYKPALELLDQLYGLRDIDFYTRPLGKKVTAHWVPPSEVLKYKEATQGLITEIGKDVIGAPVAIAKINEKLHQLRCHTLIITTGYWTNRLYKVEGLRGQAGAAFAWPESHVYQNTINVWAPYKQVVVFNNWRPGVVWAGDGSAILPQNWTEERELASLERCAREANLSADKAAILFGIRPYVKGLKTCFLEKPEKGVWVITGGAKNGTAAAGWAASQVIRAET